ncbi:YibE/F family protein [Metabacillus idriensis]|uniref:YibE/F family protein n=1 Tax=Metabacillus idriensis TaxID=324768 RepID=UPI0017490761|nr:YibE/F family protein [Metabacillus idriensis]
MNVLVCLASILLLLMILIDGRKGARSFIALFLNFGVLFFTILFMADPNLDPILLTLAACGVISCINLFFINEVNKKTTTAFISTIITLAILFMIIVMLTDHTMIQGFGEEESEELSMFSRYIGVDFIRIGASVIIMSTIGAITDIAISITSPMHEIVKHNPTISRKDLYASGIEIGRDILGTNTNTLFFAFFGSYLGLLIWFKELSYSLGDIVNSKVFSAEIITILCAGIGVAIIIPIASWIAAAFFIMKKETAEQDK